MPHDDDKLDISEEELRKIQGELGKAAIEATRKISPNIVAHLSVKFPGQVGHFSDWHDKFGDGGGPFRDAFGKAGGLGAIVVNQIGPKPK